ncbi:MAG TPA: T9SS type A sorting domain-containing protein [Candidatus Cloacimonetes bacterium]|nr:T9SS type A sorting domain-containing protein [Candidatus Cloacimonadota bacterium]
MKKEIFLMFLFLGAISLLGDIPEGYYDGTEGLSGIQLKIVLHNIIDDHNSVSYSSIHGHFENTDQKPNGKVWDMYSDIPGGNPPYEYDFIEADQCGQYDEEGDCYNKEHSWPSSWFNGNFPMRSDLFHIYPTDGYVNSHRGNLPYGEVGNIDWISMNGSKKGDCSYPGYSGTVFEPIDEYKGDFARSYFYMSVRYYNEDNGWIENGMVEGAELKTWAVNLLSEWHLNDPVSEKELDRNDAVYEIQENRNPFIDHPEFAGLVWGFTAVENETIIPEYNLSVFPNPFKKEMKINFQLNTENIEDTEISIYNLRGQKVKRFSIDDDRFSIEWNGKDERGNLLSSGIYYIILEKADRILASKKCLLMR